MIQNNSSIVELDKNAIANNVDFIRSQIGKGVKLSCVVKANAYGHSIEQMVPELENNGVRHFSVFSSFEAREVYQATRKKSTIMIMGDISNEDLPWVVEKQIECFVYNFHTLKKLVEEGIKQKIKVCIHVELETGMNRHGYSKTDWEELIDYLRKEKDNYILQGLCTHFAGAESSANYKRIQDQQEVFLNGLSVFRDNNLIPQNVHSSCSAAILAYPEFNHDLVRIGILTYGLWPSTEMELTYKIKNKTQKSPLKRVLSWKSRITDISFVESGEFIGYGNSYLAETDMKIASVPVGYGYGFNRSLSNTGRVIVNGVRLSVVGIVNMNMFLIDASNVDVSINDEVIIIGRHGDKSINVKHFGNLSDTLNYELLTRIDKAIPRVIV
ncbi:MAG: alanine racemase [Fluviicola sp.]|nr:MAG: alanine racemase [Fluviicola sp.]